MLNHFHNHIARNRGPVEQPEQGVNSDGPGVVLGEDRVVACEDIDSAFAVSVDIHDAGQLGFPGSFLAWDQTLDFMPPDFY